MYAYVCYLQKDACGGVIQMLRAHQSWVGESEPAGDAANTSRAL